MIDTTNELITIIGECDIDVNFSTKACNTTSLTFENDDIVISSTNVVANIDNNRIGSALIRDYGDGEIFLANFIIDEKYRGKGYGKQALKQLIKEFNVNSLTVGVNDDIAKHIYENAGFKIVKEPYYDENVNENVYYMRRF